MKGFMMCVLSSREAALQTPERGVDVRVNSVRTWASGTYIQEREGNMTDNKRIGEQETREKEYDKSGITCESIARVVSQRT